MQTCQKCKSDVRDGARICRVCGAIVDDPIDSAPTAATEIDFPAPEGDALDPAATKLDRWVCATCREEVEPSFDLCWNCGTHRDGTPDPDFRRVDDIATDGLSGTQRGVDVAGESTPDSALSPSKSCPDCQGELRTIRLIDHSGQNHSHQELTYAQGDAERGWFFGRFEEAGKVVALMCCSCGRILLYGEPH